MRSRWRLLAGLVLVAVVLIGSLVWLFQRPLPNVWLVGAAGLALGIDLAFVLATLWPRR